MNNTKQTISLDQYDGIAPHGVVDLINRIADKLRNRSMLHVNSTRVGGGVAEMLIRLIPIFQELGIETRWETMTGTPLFFKTTKSFHNALQGQSQTITQEMYDEYLAVNARNIRDINLDADFGVIHDPQPASFIDWRPGGAKWLWRCHIDISNPQRRVWHFLREYVSRYDGAIFSLPSFAQRLPIPQYMVYPSIDPLSDKNRELTKKEISKVVAKYGLPDDKPIIIQVSRFDRFKDPLGVIEAYKIVKKHNDCALVLAGGGATDDPEGMAVLHEVQEAAAQDKDITVLDLPPDAHLEINALQRASEIILQKSTKEGFGLTVAEGMWKGKPVIGGAVGGITVQILNGQTGYTVNSVEGAAYRMRYLLNNPKLAKHIGEKAKEYTRRNFLITRHLSDYLALMATSLGVGI